MVDPDENAQRLRREAELAAIKNAPPRSLEQQAEQNHWPAAARHMVHELQVHQIELEMQNEELRRTQQELAATKARYFELYDLAPVAFCTINADGLIKEVNLSLCALLDRKRSDLLNRPITSIIFNQDQDDFYLMRKELLARQEKQSCELGLVRAAKELPIAVHLTATATTTVQDEFEIRLILTDLTEINRQKHANRIAEAKMAQRGSDDLRYKFALEGAGEGMWDWDIANNTVFYSLRFKAMLGFTHDEFGNGFDEWSKRVHPDDVERAMADVQAHIKGATPTYNNEHRIRHKDGSWRWMLGRGQVIERDETGKALRMLGTYSDVTNAKNIEDRLHFALSEIRAQTNALNQHVIVATTDLQGVITYANEKFVAMSGYSRAELVGKTHQVINSGTHPPEFFRAMWTTISGGKIWHDDICNRAKDGSLYWVDSTIAPLLDKNEKPYAYIAIRTDTTAVHLAKLNLATEKKHVEQLNLELSRQTAQAIELAAKAELANQAKSSFLANMSHEIRTPLNGVLGLTELLLGTSLNAEQENYARTAYRSGEGLMTVLNDLLDFSKIEAGKLELEVVAFNPGQLTYDVVDLFRPRVSGHAVELFVDLAADLPENAMGDPGRWRQVLINLIGNAVKFTMRGHILIDLKRQDGHFILIVSDTGIGIPADRIEGIFALFEQADSSTTRRFGGTGLGLVITRRLCEIMGGKLTVVSIEGEGTTFTARLPLPLAVTNEETVTHNNKSSALNGMRLLVVDDNEVHAQILCEQLRRNQAIAEYQTNPALALVAINTAAEAGDPFTTVMIDFAMPIMNGTELAAAIQVEPKNAKLALIILTGLGMRGDAEEMEKQGFAGYLVKPIPIDLLIAVVALATERHLKHIPGIVTRHTITDSNGRDSRGSHPLPNTPRILLVEDQPVNQLVAKDMLSRLGAMVQIANNGKEALELIEREHFDLLFMDCQMPVMDGFEATAAIRLHEQRHGLKRVPIIAMTANAMVEDRTRCFAAGMDDHLAKPIKERLLNQVLHQWLGEKTASTFHSTERT